MQEWFGFYATMAGAAAALLGLLFVSVSINAVAILGKAHEASRRMAEQAFQNYLAVLLISFLALFPGLEPARLGAIALAIAAIRGGFALSSLYLAWTTPSQRGQRRHWLRRQLSFLIGFALLIFASLRMAFSWGDSRNLFAAAILILLFSATVVSWGLLLRIAAADPA